MLISLVAMVPLWLRLGLLAGMLAAWAKGRARERVRKKAEIFDFGSAPIRWEHTEISEPVDMVVDLPGGYDSGAVVYVNGSPVEGVVALKTVVWYRDKPGKIAVVVVGDHGEMTEITYRIRTLNTMGCAL